MAWDMWVAALNLAVSTLTSGLQWNNAVKNWKATSETKKYEWVDRDAAIRASTGAFVQLALTRISFQAMYKLLKDNSISEKYPFHPGERKTSGIPNDDTARFRNYYEDWSHHLEILEKERSIVVHYDPPSADLSSSPDQDLVQELEELKAALEQLQQNHQMDIEGVERLILGLFTETKDRLAERLGLDEFLDRPARADDRSDLDAEGFLRDTAAAGSEDVSRETLGRRGVETRRALGEGSDRSSRTTGSTDR